MVEEEEGQYAAALQSYQQALAIDVQLGKHGADIDRTQRNIDDVTAKMNASPSPSPQPS